LRTAGIHRETLPVGIMAIGRYLPERIVTNDELARTLDTSDAWITERIGIRTRRVAAPGQLSSDLGVEALKDACDRAGIGLDEIDLLISGSNTPDHISPPLACMIMRKTGMTEAAGFDVRSGGCPAGVFTLDVAAQYVATGRYRTVAVVLPEVNSRVVDPADRTTAVLLGDAATCYLLRPCTPGTGILHTVLRNDPSGYYTGHVPAGGLAMPITPDVQARGLHYFHMDGPTVWKWVHQVIPGFVEEFVEDAGITLHDPDLYVFHQANLNIIHNVMDRLGLPRSKTFTNLDKYANTSSSSVPLAIHEAVLEGRLGPGDVLCTVGFGAGMSYGANLIRWNRPGDFDV